MPNDETLRTKSIERELRGENPSARMLQRLNPALAAAFVPPDTATDTVLELVVTIETGDIPTKEFSSYLALIDRLYGRLSREGLRSYAHSTSARLLISDIHKSELEVIFRALYQDDTARLIAILLFLKSLPNMFNLGPEVVMNLPETYTTYEQD